MRSTAILKSTVCPCSRGSHVVVCPSQCRWKPFAGNMKLAWWRWGLRCPWWTASQTLSPLPACGTAQPPQQGTPLADSPVAVLQWGGREEFFHCRKQPLDATTTIIESTGDRCRGGFSQGVWSQCRSCAPGGLQVLHEGPVRQVWHTQRGARCLHGRRQSEELYTGAGALTCIGICDMMS